MPVGILKLNDLLAKSPDPEALHFLGPSSWGMGFNEKDFQLLGIVSGYDYPPPFCVDILA